MILVVSTLFFQLPGGLVSVRDLIFSNSPNQEIHVRCDYPVLVISYNTCLADKITHDETVARARTAAASGTLNFYYKAKKMSVC